MTDADAPLSRSSSDAEPSVVLIDALSSVFGGGITVAQRITDGMARLRPDCRFLLYFSHPQLAEPDYPKNVELQQRPDLLARPRRWAWEQCRLPGEARRRGAQVILGLGGFTSFATHIPQVSVWQNPNIFKAQQIEVPLREAAYIGLQRLAQTASMRKAVTNVFLTRNSAEMAALHWPMDRIPHEVIHSGVDPVPRRQPSADSRDGPPRALSIGHTYFHKNYDNMIRAIAEYRSRYEDVLELEIVGAPYDRAYQAKLEALIRELKLQDLVFMTGLASREAVEQKLADARVYIVTSVLETFGLTPLEAMSVGLPVVAANASCTPEVCGDAALYCDPYDPADIAEKLRRAVTDDALRSELERRGNARVQKFSWPNAAHSYLEVLDRAARMA